MAILEKRKAVNKLPRFERYQDTRAGDRAAALRGEPARLRSEAPITSAIRQLAGSSGYGPMSDQGFNQMGGRPPYSMGEDGRGLPPDMGGAGRATVDKFGNTAGQPQTAVTSALKGSTGATAGKATGTGNAAGVGATAGKVAGTTASKLPNLTSKVATDAKTDATKAATGAKTITPTANTTAGAKTITSTGSGKTAGVTAGTGAKTAGSTLGNTLTSALAGAALGAGTKFVIDKLTGTKKAADTGAGTDKAVAGNGARTGLTSKVNPLGTNIGKNIVDTGVKKVVDASKTGLKLPNAVTSGPTSVVKGDPAVKKTPAGASVATPPFVPAGAKAPAGAKLPVKTGPKAPKEAVAKTPITSTTRSLGAPKGEPKSNDTLKEDTVVTGVAYDDDGNLMPGYELDENGNPVFVGDSDSSTTYNPDGSTGVESTGVAYDEDGNLMPGYELDENGDPVFVGDATSTIYDPSGGSITGDTKTIDDLDTVTDTVIDNIENNDGTTTTVYADGSTVTRDGTGSVVDANDPVEASGVDDAGSVVETSGDSDGDSDGDSGGFFSDTDGNLYDAEGNLVQYADGTLVGEEATSEENSFDNEVAFTDENGDTYNASGVLLSEGDHSGYVYTAEDGSTYDYDGKLITEADHSDFVQYDAAGNSFDYDGNIISYAEGYGAQDEYAASDEYTAADEFSDEDLYGAKGGLIGMRRGGAPVHMVEGGDPSDDGEPVHEEENADGTITKYWDDGSSMHIGQDDQVISVTDTEGVEEFPTRDELRRMMQDSVTLRELNEDLYARTGQSYNTIEEAQTAKQKLDYESSDEFLNEIEPTPQKPPQQNPEDYDPYAEYGGRDVYSDPFTRGFGSAFPTEIDQSYGSTDNSPVQTRSLSGNSLTSAEMQQILDDRKISRQAMERQQIEDDFNAEESLANYRAKNGLEPLNKESVSTSVPASSQNLQGTKYFSDSSFIVFDKYGDPFQTGDADGNRAPYSPGIKPSVNSQATATLAVNPNYSDTTEEVQDFQNVNNISLRNSPVSVSAALPEGWPPAGFSLNDDGSNTATYVDREDGSTITIDVDNNIIDVTDANGDTVVQDNQPVTTGGLGQANQNIEYFDDGSYRETFEDGTSIIFDAEGNPFSSMDNEGNTEIATTRTYDDFGNQTISDYYGNIVKVLDPEGNVIPLGGGRVNTAPITGVGSSGAAKVDQTPNAAEIAGKKKSDDGAESAISDLMKKLNTYGGAGAAGAVLGGLLGNTDLFGGGGGGSSFDMGGYGAIDPRTTNFGVGPANYVGYDEYGTPEEMPELYGNELYQNLNAPGFNEVNPGDYARMDEEEFGPEPMAEGGMPQGGLGQTSPQTYYTFGKPVDPLQNLRNPMPFQHQQQMPPQAAQQPPQMPQGAPQMPPMGQGMPQMGMPPQMRRGGLPRASNVPMTQGRMDFRQGSAVHGAGDGQSDDIPAMLADGEYVFDAETVAQIGNGSTKAGAEALDRFRENIRAHKRSAPVNKIPPKTKALTSYLKGAR